MKTTGSQIFLSILALSFSLSACNSSETRAQKETRQTDEHAKLTMNGKLVPDAQASGTYMIFKKDVGDNTPSVVNITFHWDSHKEGQVEEPNRLFMINADGLQTGDYKVVQISQKGGTGGLAYVIRKNDKGHQQNFGVLKQGTLTLSKIDTLHHLCSGKCTGTLQDNNGEQTVTFTAEWNGLPLGKSEMP